jgi:hypothetical protein
MSRALADIRIYNPSIGKFLSVDPLTKDYSYYSPYQFAGNSPIQAIDIDGLEKGYVQYHNVIIDEKGKYITKATTKPILETENGDWSGVKNRNVFIHNNKLYDRQDQIAGWSDWKKSTRITKQKVGKILVSSGKTINTTGDLISAGSIIAAAPSGGVSTPGIFIGETIGVAGKIIENVGNFMVDGANTETFTSMATDIAFELLPSVATKGIKSLDINTAAEKIAREATVNAGKNPDLLVNSENLVDWQSRLVIMAAEEGIDNKTKENKCNDECNDDNK